MDEICLRSGFKYVEKAGVLEKTDGSIGTGYTGWVDTEASGPKRAGSLGTLQSPVSDDHRRKAP